MNAVRQGTYMATNKNQHFVPKAHLKPFSLDQAGAAINVFNLDSGKAIPRAPVKSQCSRDYFYGRDEQLEKAIQFVEGSYALCVASLADGADRVLPGHEVVLRRFAYLQHVRTEAAARRSAEFAFAMSSVKGSDIEQPPFRDALYAAVIDAMRHYAESMEIVDDLKVRVVRNRTNRPFITSDDPAILANRWHQRDARTTDRSFGIGSAGAILFLPLTPSLLALLFDGDVYSAEHVGGWVDVTSTDDVDACNLHQALNCVANLYFGREDDGPYLAGLSEQMIDRRPKERFVLHKAVLDGGSETHKRYAIVDDPDIREHKEVLLHIQSIRPVPPTWPRFLKFRAGGVVFTNDTGAGFRRRSRAFSEWGDAPPWRKVRA